MKRLLLCSLLALPPLPQARMFVPIPLPLEGNLPLTGVIAGSVAFADVDGDNDQDIFICGLNQLNVPTAILYANDGNNTFSIMSDTPFQGISSSSVAFADVDGDNDQDLLISGRDTSYAPTTALYINDGSGSFSIVSDAPFEAVASGSVAFADVDGDNDQDLLISGINASNAPTTALYINNGSGSFSIVGDTPFEGVTASSAAFADIDGDNDPDLLISGRNASKAVTARLYTNDGSGSFSIVNDTPFEGVATGSVAFTDVDGDSDQDLIITGMNASNIVTARLYNNDGSGSFPTINDTLFEGVYYSSIAFADVDGDNDSDLLISGRNASFTPTVKLYTNDGKGEFARVNDLPLGTADGSSVAFADIDGDNDQDLLITGMNVSSAATATLYANTLNAPASVEPIPTSKEKLSLFFPNPVTNTSVALSYSAEKFGELFISVSDAAGKTLLHRQVAVSEGENTIPLDCTDLPKGAYIVELRQGDHSASTKLVIQ